MFAVILKFFLKSQRLKQLLINILTWKHKWLSFMCYQQVASTCISELLILFDLWKERSERLNAAKQWWTRW